MIKCAKIFEKLKDFIADSGQYLGLVIFFSLITQPSRQFLRFSRVAITMMTTINSWTHVVDEILSYSILLRTC